MDGDDRRADEKQDMPPRRLSEDGFFRCCLFHAIYFTRRRPDSQERKIFSTPGVSGRFFLRLLR
jgi:hypothetical protein